MGKLCALSQTKPYVGTSYLTEGAAIPRNLGAGSPGSPGESTPPTAWSLSKVLNSTVGNLLLVLHTCELPVHYFHSTSQVYIEHLLYKE